jgi:hypothetical protein
VLMASVMVCWSKKQASTAMQRPGRNDSGGKLRGNGAADARRPAN